MAQRLRAIYQNGAFVPQAPCDLPENSEVDLVIEKPHVLLLLVPPSASASSNNWWNGCGRILFRPMLSIISRAKNCMNAVDTNILIYARDPAN